ncbi:hypothetical protein AR457_08530 [Streptomyces agglomeratus]|nr:hypothetical protein [Streptomyces agglomeratus]OEJ44142.1 hypothetical protein AR457_08530 [Streptomyces agglomeratus]
MTKGLGLPTPGFEELVAFVGEEYVDGLEGGVGVGDGCFEQVEIAGDELFDGFAVEEVGGVFDYSFVAGVAVFVVWWFDDVEEEVES